MMTSGACNNHSINQVFFVWFQLNSSSLLPLPRIERLGFTDSLRLEYFKQATGNNKLNMRHNLTTLISLEFKLIANINSELFNEVLR